MTTFVIDAQVAIDLAAGGATIPPELVRDSEDAPASQAAEDARSSLQNGLLKLASESKPPLQC